MADLHRALGAGPASGASQVVLFVPSVDRSGEPIDQPYWAQEALTAFARLFRGATAFPPGRGAWRDDDADGALVFDDTQMVISYVDPSLLDDAGILRALRQFVHRLGREAHQGEVGVVIDGRYFGITEFEEES